MQIVSISVEEQRATLDLLKANRDIQEYVRQTLKKESV
jgi:hypothetical protein